MTVAATVDWCFNKFVKFTAEKYVSWCYPSVEGNNRTHMVSRVEWNITAGAYACATAGFVMAAASIVFLNLSGGAWYAFYGTCLHILADASLTKKDPSNMGLPESTNKEWAEKDFTIWGYKPQVQGVPLFKKFLPLADLAPNSLLTQALNFFRSASTSNKPPQ